MRNRPFIKTMIVGLVASVTLVGPIAQPALARMAAGCEIHIGNTYTVAPYGNIYFSGSKTCVDGPPGITHLQLQRYRWYGWEPVSSMQVISYWSVTNGRYDCIGTGIHTYAAWISANIDGRDYVSKKSNEITVDCGG